MNKLSNAVSIHPYFKINEGKVEEFKKLISQFVTATSQEETCLYYDFSISDSVAFCREAYVDAAAVLVHLENVGGLIEQSGSISEMIKLEMHGPAAELDKLRGPLAELPIVFFPHVEGIER